MKNINAKKTRCGRIRLEMDPEVAANLLKYVGHTTFPQLQGKEYISNPRITENAEEIFNMCCGICGPLNSIVKEYY